MLVFTARLNSTTAIVSSVVYGLSMIILYSMSTLYHATSPGPRKAVLQIIDHSSVFLLIAGTYTPIILIVLGGTPKSLALLVGVWVAALIGIALNAKNMARFRKVSMVLYLLMGWAILIDIPRIASLLGTAGTALLVPGGLSYTVGVIFYKLKKIKYMHGVWHLFVLAGSVLHYICILRFIV